MNAVIETMGIARSVTAKSMVKRLNGGADNATQYLEVKVSARGLLATMKATIATRMTIIAMERRLSVR